MKKQAIQRPAVFCYYIMWLCSDQAANGGSSKFRQNLVVLNLAGPNHFDGEGLPEMQAGGILADSSGKGMVSRQMLDGPNLI